MDKKNMMRDFIKTINDKELMTQFIKNIFGYKDFFDHNYLFRLIDKDDRLIIDIYDNVTDSRFNRYIYCFSECDYVLNIKKVDNLYIHNIGVLNLIDDDNKLFKLGYLFKINCADMLEYANTFLDDKFVLILKDIIK